MSDLEIEVSNRAMELVAEGMAEDEAWAQALKEILPEVAKRTPKYSIPKPPAPTSALSEFLSDALGAARRIADANGTDPETAWQKAVTETIEARRKK